MRYTQQILVEEIGLSGQHQISSARVLIIGAGGLGVPLGTYLASAGVGSIGIADGDVITESNLHRQFLYEETEIGKGKAEVLCSKLRKINPHIDISVFSSFVDYFNGTELLKNYDIVCDCSDNAESRLLIDKLCQGIGLPLVYAAVRDWQGYLTVLHYNKKISLSDIFDPLAIEVHAANNCSVSGIVNTTCAVLAGMQATEVLKVILQQPSNVDGAILCVNVLENVFRLLKLKKKTE